MNIAPHLATLYGWPLAVLALAIYSITRLITEDSFPPIERARTWFFDKFPHDGFSTKIRPNPKRAKFIVTGDHYHVTVGHWLGELVSCLWCAGWWVSVAVCTAFWFWPVATVAVCVPFAFRVIPGIIGAKLH